MRRDPADRRPRGGGRPRSVVRHATGAAAATLVWSCLAAALAHATLVFGTVSTEPAPVRADEPAAVVLEMRDPVDAPVEDAVVFVEARPPAGEPVLESDRFTEIEPGVYRTELVLPAQGEWTLRFRDQTFRQEEAQATITLNVGASGDTEPRSFIFPPTATGPQSLTTWLAWLIGLPLVAAAVVTVMVLRGGATAAAAGDEGGPPA
ncbi:MAG: FixH family protein [Trueperaceae bacterium]|nr:FixH family protein [Trueperaceae bacterium]